MALFLAQGLRYVVSRGPNTEEGHHSDGIPIIASPVDPKAYTVQGRDGSTDDPASKGVRKPMTIAQLEAEPADDKLAGRIFRKQHESSTLELFFDLFFVANLSVFTSNHAHVDALSVANYIGFFSILWSTWFHVSIYDVRFYTDSVFSRLCKLMFFGIMIAYVGLGPVYDAILEQGESQSFKGLALVLMASRFILCVQHGVVLYFVHGFQKTLVPLVLMILTYFLAGMAFLGTYLADKGTALNGTEGSIHVIRWYIILAIEGVAVITISSIWRILSFKHTHLVERVGLLTLIILGEGIIGLARSIAFVLAGVSISVWSHAGLVISAVLVIYFIFQLYFDNIPHDRFGSRRQQIWVLLHYLLHVAILLTVEGQTALITWTACRSGISWFEAHFPSSTDPATGFDSTTALVAAVNESITATTTRFHYASLSDYYNVTPDITALQDADMTGSFGSAEWNATTSEILTTIKANIEYFIFENFQAEGPEIELEEANDPAEKVEILNKSFRVAFEYFFIGAGGLLLILAVMYWFGRNNKSRGEYSVIAVRLAVGMALPCVSALAFMETEGETTGYRYSKPSWIIPIVTFCYLIVLLADNLIKMFEGVKRRKGERKPDGDASTLADKEAGHGGKQVQVKQPHFQDGGRLNRVQHSDVTSTRVSSSSSQENQGGAQIDKHSVVSEPESGLEHKPGLQHNLRRDSQ